jgi:hypothetical protein
MTTDGPVPMSLSQEPLTRGAVTSRNLSLQVWTRVVLQRHGGRFATHKVFAFLVFNMLVRYRNHRVSMISVTRKDFPEVERVVQSLSAERLEKAREELEALGKTSDDAVNRLLRSLSLYGLRQPMSRELRLGMRRKIKSPLAGQLSICARTRRSSAMPCVASDTTVTPRYSNSIGFCSVA